MSLERIPWLIRDFLEQLLLSRWLPVAACAHSCTPGDCRCGAADTEALTLLRVGVGPWHITWKAFLPANLGCWPLWSCRLCGCSWWPRLTG